MGSMKVERITNSKFPDVNVKIVTPPSFAEDSEDIIKYGCKDFRIEKALKKCKCPHCEKDILKGDYRVPFRNRFYHLKCFAELCRRLSENYKKWEKRIFTREKDKLEDEYDKKIMRSI